MRILSRYVLAELLQVFLVALSALTLFMLVVGLVKEAQQQGLGLIQIAKLVPYVLPEAMRFAVPGTMLFAVASVFGRMSATNEITALKAAGISPMAAMWPAFGLAVVVSFVSVWLNDVAVSWGRDGIRRVIVSSVEEIMYGRLRQHRSYSAPHISINVKSVDGKTLKRPTLSYQPDDGEPVTVSAETAEMHADPEKGTLRVTCTNGTFQMGDVKVVFTDSWNREIALDSVSRKGGGTQSPSEIAMADFPSAIAEQHRRIRQCEELAAAKVGLATFSGRLDMTVPEHLVAEREMVKNETARLHRIEMEPWRRWANGFSCLCFVLVGAPMAIRMRNADFLTSFFMCFLPILLVYYPVFMAGVSQAKSGAVPPVAVWAGNLLVTLWGMWLMRSVIRT